MLGTCTAGAIATPNPDDCQATEALSEVAAWLTDRDYDSAPVYDDDRPMGYITREAATDTADDTSLEGLMEPLTVDVLIARDTPLDGVLNALYDRPFYYLADRNDVTGILTRADLNTEPVYQHLYTSLSRLEHALRDTIQTHEPDWQDTTPLHPDILDDIESRREDAKAADVSLDPIHYAQFSTLVTIIANSDACAEALGFDSTHRASSDLSDITNLRNDVAHSTPIIQNTERGLTETGRTITDLLEQYTLIQDILTTHDK